MSALLEDKTEALSSIRELEIRGVPRGNGAQLEVKISHGKNHCYNQMAGDRENMFLIYVWQMCRMRPCMST